MFNFRQVCFDFFFCFTKIPISKIGVNFKPSLKEFIIAFGLQSPSILFYSISRGRCRLCWKNLNHTLQKLRFLNLNSLLVSISTSNLLIYSTFHVYYAQTDNCVGWNLNIFIYFLCYYLQQFQVAAIKWRPFQKVWFIQITLRRQKEIKFEPSEWVIIDAKMQI